MMAMTPVSRVLSGRERVRRAARGEPVDRVPVWLMRQAGRYLPEYRQVRAEIDFRTAVKTPEVATELTLQPLRRYPLDAAIVFSDIMMPAEAMGMNLAFDPGPVLDPPLRTRADIERLRVPENGSGLEYIAETVLRIRRAVGDETAIYGFAGAPITLATYMCEGRGGGKEFTALKRLLHADPSAAHQLLERLAKVVAGSLVAQVQAGADLVQLFDTWAGLLDPVDYATFALPHLRAIVDIVRRRAPGTPIVYFARHSGGMLDAIAETGADVIGLDWTIEISAARRALGPRPIQGNLDPALLLAPPEALAERARTILAGGGGTGHIFNLGHGVHLDTPPESVAHLVEVVHAFVPPAAPPPAAAESRTAAAGLKGKE
jgi:uroporphyrinogen decarboxylase